MLNSRETSVGTDIDVLPVKTLSEMVAFLIGFSRMATGIVFSHTEISGNHNLLMLWYGITHSFNLQVFVKFSTG
jgi:hypothetical protein